MPTFLLCFDEGELKGSAILSPCLLQPGKDENTEDEDVEGEEAVDSMAEDGDVVGNEGNDDDDDDDEVTDDDS